VTPLIESAASEMALVPEQTQADSRDERASLDLVDTVATPRIVERRVWRNTFVVIAIALCGAVVLADLRFTLGVSIGSILALLNFRWLQSSLRGVLAVGSRKVPPGTTMKFILRWLIVLAAVFLASRTRFVDPAGMTAGLFAPAAAILIEAAFLGLKTAAVYHGERS